MNFTERQRAGVQYGGLAVAICIAFLPIADLLRLFGNWDRRELLTLDDLENFGPRNVPQMHEGFTFKALYFCLFEMSILGVTEPIANVFKLLQISVFGLNVALIVFINLTLHMANAFIVLKLCHLLPSAGLWPPLPRSAHRTDLETFKWGCFGTVGFWATHPLRVQVVAWCSCQPLLLSSVLALGGYYLHVNRFVAAWGGAPSLRGGSQPDGGSYPVSPQMDGAYLLGAAMFLLATLCKANTIPISGMFFLSSWVHEVAVETALQKRKSISLISGDDGGGGGAPKSSKKKKKKGDGAEQGAADVEDDVLGLTKPNMSQIALIHVMPVLRALLDCWPYFLISFATLSGAIKANAETQGPWQWVELIDRIKTKAPSAGLAVLWYLSHSLAPGDLSIRYRFPETSYPVDWLPGLVLLVAAFAPVVLVAAWALDRRTRVEPPKEAIAWVSTVAVLFICFVCLLSPTLGFIIHASTGLVADRYAYLPSILLVPLSGELWRFVLRFTARLVPEPGSVAPFRPPNGSLSKSAKKKTALPLLPPLWVSASLAVAVSAAWGQGFVTQTRYNLTWWTNSQKVFSRAVAINPQDALSWSALGSTVAKFDPELAEQYYNRAAALSDANTDGSAEQFIKSKSEITDAHCQAAFQREAWDEAESCYMAKMMSYEPGAFYRTVAQFNLARVLNVNGKPKEALNHLKEVMKVKKRNGDVLLQMGIAYKNIGDYVMAAQMYQDALDIEPNFVDCLYNFGNLRVFENDLDGAIVLWERLLQLDPRRVTLFTHLVDQEAVPLDFRDYVRQVAEEQGIPGSRFNQSPFNRNGARLETRL